MIHDMVLCVLLSFFSSNPNGLPPAKLKSLVPRRLFFDPLLRLSFRSGMPKGLYGRFLLEAHPHASALCVVNRLYQSCKLGYFQQVLIKAVSPME